MIHLLRVFNDVYDNGSYLFYPFLYVRLSLLEEIKILYGGTNIPFKLSDSLGMQLHEPDVLSNYRLMCVISHMSL